MDKLDNYKIAVVAIIEHNNKVLVGKRIKDPGHLLSEEWHIPGGRLEDEEDENQALIREINEETGIDIKIERFLDERIVHENKIIAKWYVCSPLNHNLKAGDDLTEVKYIPKSEIVKICPKKAISLFPSKVIKYLNIEL